MMMTFWVKMLKTSVLRKLSCQNYSVALHSPQMIFCFALSQIVELSLSELAYETICRSWVPFAMIGSFPTNDSLFLPTIGCDCSTNVGNIGAHTSTEPSFNVGATVDPDGLMRVGVASDGVLNEITQR